MTTKKTKAEAPKAEETSTAQPVLVTTAHRGVFFGYLDGEPSKEKVKLTKMRNVLYWDTETRGFVGLASNGPSKGCRIGPAAPGESTIFDVTLCTTCSPDAVKRFEEAPWSR